MSYYTGGNILSFLAFFIWIPVALYGMRRWPPAMATAVLFFGGLLLLPEVMFFKLPGLLEFAKLEIIATWLFIGAAIFHRERLASAPKSWWFRVCVVVLLIGSVSTVLLNTDGFRVASRYVPGQVPYDATHAVIGALLSVVVPFYLGSAMFGGSRDLRVLLTTMVVAALLYSPLQFVELILSPQLHKWVYGFHQHSFLQAMRGEGYRPMVFMAHGLAVAVFTLLAIVAAAALYKGKVRVLRISAAQIMVYLWVVLALSKSIASLLYSWIAVPLVWFVSPRVQALAAAALAALLLVYPMARATDLIPVEALETWAEDQFGQERAGSMMFRLRNEGELLDRAMERPWFGWGGYCRACLFEPWSGDLSLKSVRDGAWIIEFGDHGIVGFLARFSLLLFPLLVLVRRIKHVLRSSDRRLLAGLGLMVGFAAFDLIPNGDFSRMAFVLSGALWGCTTGVLQEAAVMRKRRWLAHVAKKEARNGGTET